MGRETALHVAAVGVAKSLQAVAYVARGSSSSGGSPSTHTARDRPADALEFGINLVTLLECLRIFGGTTLGSNDIRGHFDSKAQPRASTNGRASTASRQPASSRVTRSPFVLSPPPRSTSSRRTNMRSRSARGPLPCADRRRRGRAQERDRRARVGGRLEPRQARLDARRHAPGYPLAHRLVDRRRLRRWSFRRRRRRL